MEQLVHLLVGAAAAAVLLCATALTFLEILPERAKRQLLCRRLNYHSGHVTAEGEHLYLQCHRCGELAHPVRREVVRSWRSEE